MVYSFLIRVSVVLLLFLNGCSQQTLSQKFIDYFKNNCQERKECIVDLHKITPFLWDQAYFLYKYDKRHIQEITNTSYDFDTDVGTQIVFINKNKVVAYEEIPLPVSDFAFSKSIAKERLNIEFRVKKNNLNDLTYEDYYKLDAIKYYCIQRNNDKLKVVNYVKKTGDVLQKIYTVYPTNIQQIQMQ